MNHLKAVLALSVAGLSLGTFPADGSDAVAAPPATAASIPFAADNIFNWQADGEKGIWVQAVNRKWYYGTFMSPCNGMPFREGVHFKLAPSGELDRWGAVIIPHYPGCFFKTFVQSNGPPDSKKIKPPAVTAPAGNSVPSAGPAG